MSFQDTQSTAHSRTMVPPADYAATEPTGGTNISVDTRGFRFARIDLIVGTVAGTGIAWKIQDSADDSSFADFTPITGTTATGPTLTTANDNQVHTIIVDCQSRRRYLRLAWTFTSMTASPLAATAMLSRPTDSAFQYAGTESLGSGVGAFPRG